MRTWSNSLRPRARLNLQRSYLMARGPRVRAWFSLLKLQRQRQPSVRFVLCIFFVSEIVGVVQPSSSNTCMGDDPLMYASMTAGTHLPPQRPKVARLCQCSRMPSEWFICYFLRSDIVWVTSPYVCRSRGSLGKTKMAEIRILANGLFELQP